MQRQLISIPTPNKLEIEELKTVLDALAPIQFNEKLGAYTVGVNREDVYKTLVSKKQRPQSFFCRAYMGIFEYKILNTNKQASYLFSILETQLDQYAAWLAKAKEYVSKSKLLVTPASNSPNESTSSNKRPAIAFNFNSETKKSKSEVQTPAVQKGPSIEELKPIIADDDFTDLLRDFYNHPETQWLNDDNSVVVKPPRGNRM